MTIAKILITTTLPKAFQGWKPKEPGNHVIALVPGVAGAGPNVCFLCSNEVPEATAHLELSCYAEMTNDELAEGMRICVSCASMKEMDWKKAIREHVIENLAYVISKVPSLDHPHDPREGLPKGHSFYFDMNCISGDLICLHQLADMGCVGIDIQPEALEFIRMHGGVE